MSKMRVIGLMSGTSLDGLDLVDVTIWEHDESLDFKINNTSSIAYTQKEQSTLKNCFEASEEVIRERSIWYGEFLGKAVNNFVREFDIQNIDFVASHGHTVFHKPEAGITVQIGDGQVLSNVSGFEVICDFRTQDVALGGQGAPLVPIGDQFLFPEYSYCLNIGGFANVSFDDHGVRKAFDICPVNIVLNHYTRKIGLEYDDGGFLARSGELNSNLLEELNNLPFYSEPYPKSLGYEFVVEEVIPLIDKYEIPIPNILRTFIAHVVYQLGENLSIANSTALATGGGAYNHFLIDELQKKCNSKIVIPSKEIIDFKEALIFALLGYLRKQEKVNCLKSVTGASRNHSSGKIFQPK